MNYRADVDSQRFSGWSTFGGTRHAGMGGVKNLLLVALIVAGGYWLAHHKLGHERDNGLVGTRTQGFMHESTPSTIVLHLEAGGSALLKMDYTEQGQRMTREVSGQWRCAQNHFSFTFTPGSAPSFLDARNFDGGIVTLDAETLQFKTVARRESRTRVP
jgi:hypothetical protein